MWDLAIFEHGIQDTNKIFVDGRPKNLALFEKMGDRICENFEQDGRIY